MTDSTQAADAANILVLPQLLCDLCEIETHVLARGDALLDL